MAEPEALAPDAEQKAAAYRALAEVVTQNSNFLCPALYWRVAQYYIRSHDHDER